MHNPRIGAFDPTRREHTGGCHLPDVTLLATRDDAPASGLVMCRGVPQPAALPSCTRLLILVNSRRKAEGR